MPPESLEQMIVGDVIERWPATVTVFHGHGMACPGCAMAPFMTVAESAAAYGLKAADLVRELAARLANGEGERATR
jgi:hybrid cluster-associated redox disulfide protein